MDGEYTCGCFVCGKLFFEEDDCTEHMQTEHGGRRKDQPNF